MAPYFGAPLPQGTGSGEGAQVLQERLAKDLDWGMWNGRVSRKARRPRRGGGVGVRCVCVGSSEAARGSEGMDLRLRPRWQAQEEQQLQGNQDAQRRREGGSTATV